MICSKCKRPVELWDCQGYMHVPGRTRICEGASPTQGIAKLLIIMLVLFCVPSVYSQIPVEVRNLTIHRAPAPPVKFRGKFPAAWPCEIVGYPSLPYGEERIVLTSADFGKTWKSSGSSCVADFITYQLVTAKFAHTQQPKPESPKPLNPEASKRWVAIDKDEQEFIRQANATLQQYEARKADILIGAGIPEDSRVCVAGTDGIVACAKPKMEAAKTAPK